MFFAYVFVDVFNLADACGFLFVGPAASVDGVSS